MGWESMEHTANIDEYSLYIPRVALSSVSSASSKVSARTKESARKTHHHDIVETSGESESEGIYGSSIQNYGGGRPHRGQMYRVHKAPKRGSHSTQSSSTSSTSNLSNYGVNSLLLSVENLEQFNKSTQYSFTNRGTTLDSNYDHKRQMMENIRNILAIEDHSSLTKIGNKTKDVDELSAASSITTTNFTVVTFNEFDRQASKSKSICRRSHQATILVMCMSVLFLIGISLLVCMLEMRYQNMPR